MLYLGGSRRHFTCGELIVSTSYIDHRTEDNDPQARPKFLLIVYKPRRCDSVNGYIFLVRVSLSVWCVVAYNFCLIVQSQYTTFPCVMILVEKPLLTSLWCLMATSYTRDTHSKELYSLISVIFICLIHAPFSMIRIHTTVTFLYYNYDIFCCFSPQRVGSGTR